MPVHRCVPFALAAATLLAATSNVDAQQRRPSNQRQNQYQQQQQSRNRQQPQRTDMAARPTRPESPSEQQPGTVKEQMLTTIFSQVVMGGLSAPTGVTVQPGTNDIFVSDSGVGRIVRLNDVPGEYRFDPVITDFPLAPVGKGSSGKLGPTGIGFINKYTLAVASPATDDQEMIRLYRVPHAGSITAENTAFELGPVNAGRMFGMWADEQELLVVCDDMQGGGMVARAVVTDGQPKSLEAFAKTGQAGPLSAARALTVGRRGEVIVAQTGSVNTPNDSKLVFLEPATGKPYLEIASGLHDVSGLAVSPESGHMYAIDYAAIAPEEGGLYRLDLTQDAGQWICKPVLLMPLDRPSAMTFREDGELLITTYGSHVADQQGGLLVRVYNESKL